VAVALGVGTFGIGMFHARSTAQKVPKKITAFKKAPTAQIIAGKNKPRRLEIQAISPASTDTREIAILQSVPYGSREKVEAVETIEHQKIQASSFNSINIMAHS
jgi:hypothetical protein